MTEVLSEIESASQSAKMTGNIGRESRRLNQLPNTADVGDSEGPSAKPCVPFEKRSSYEDLQLHFNQSSSSTKTFNIRVLDTSGPNELPKTPSAVPCPRENVSVGVPRETLGAPLARLGMNVVTPQLLRSRQQSFKFQNLATAGSTASAVSSKELNPEGLIPCQTSWDLFPQLSPTYEEASEDLKQSRTWTIPECREANEAADVEIFVFVG